MTSDVKKPGWVFWTTVVLLVVPVLYVLSFGPACWLTAQPVSQRSTSANWPIGYRPEWMVIYLPIGWFATVNPTAHAIVVRWAELGMARDTTATFPANGFWTTIHR